METSLSPIEDLSLSYSETSNEKQQNFSSAIKQVEVNQEMFSRI